MIIDDNFVDEDFVAKIENAILGWQDRPIGWVFAPASNTESEDGGAVLDDNVYEHMMFVSIPDHMHPLRKEIIYLAESFFKKHKILFSEILRIKVNLVPMAPQESKGKYQLPHVDTDTEHKVFLYYVNDADGDTILFKEKMVFGEKAPDSFTIDQVVSPKRGRAIVFDGDTYHAPSAPTESPYRCVINIDFV